MFSFLKPRRKCGVCGRPAEHQEAVRKFNKVVIAHYCEECHKAQLEWDKQFSKTWDEVRKAHEEDIRYEKLKRAVELAELEEKAKKYGIKITPEDQ